MNPSASPEPPILGRMGLMGSGRTRTPCPAGLPLGPEAPGCVCAAGGTRSIWSHRNWAGERCPCRSIGQRSLWVCLNARRARRSFSTVRKVRTRSRACPALDAGLSFGTRMKRLGDSRRPRARGRRVGTMQPRGPCDLALEVVGHGLAPVVVADAEALGRVPGDGLARVVPPPCGVGSRAFGGVRAGRAAAVGSLAGSVCARRARASGERVRRVTAPSSPARRPSAPASRMAGASQGRGPRRPSGARSRSAARAAARTGARAGARTGASAAARAREGAPWWPARPRREAARSPLRGVRDHQRHAAQAAVWEATQEAGPRRALGLARTFGLPAMRRGSRKEERHEPSRHRATARAQARTAQPASPSPARGGRSPAPSPAARPPVGAPAAASIPAPSAPRPQAPASRAPEPRPPPRRSGRAIPSRPSSPPRQGSRPGRPNPSRTPATAASAASPIAPHTTQQGTARPFGRSVIHAIEDELLGRIEIGRSASPASWALEKPVLVLQALGLSLEMLVRHDLKLDAALAVAASGLTDHDPPVFPGVGVIFVFQGGAGPIEAEAA